MTPKGGELGSWLPLTLNKQLFSDSHGCTVALRERRPLENLPGDTNRVGGWIKKWGRHREVAEHGD